MKKFITHIGLLALTLFATIFLGLSAVNAQSTDANASVYTNKSDYSPGETVIIEGEGWQAGEQVKLELDHSTVSHGNTILYATADTNGYINNEEYIIQPIHLGESFILTATGQSSGLTAQTTFTDGIGNPTPIGTANSISSGTSLTISTSSGVAVGNTIILTIAMDPAAGNVSVIDNRGNTYTKYADVSNGSGTTSGVRTLVFSAPVTNAFISSSTNTITITFPTVAARAASAFLVNGLSQVSPVDKFATATGTSSTPNSGPTATTSQANELLIGAIGIEGTDGINKGSGYETLNSATANGGATTSSIKIQPEYRIVSTTGAYAATASIGSSRPWAAAIVTYKAAPFVQSVSSTVANGAYNAGDVIPITITFNVPVYVTGSPKLALNAGSGANATYSSGSGTTALTFNYTVGATHSTDDLDYTSTTALTLNGGTIKDADGNNVLLELPSPGESGSLDANTNIVIDNIVPTSSVSTPSSGSTLATLTSISGSADDDEDGSDVQKVEISLKRNADGLYWSGTTWVSGEVFLSTSGISDWSKTTGLPAGDNLLNGTYTVRSRATDNAGNVQTPGTGNTFTITSPVTKATGGGSICSGNVGGAYTALTGPIYKEFSDEDVNTGTIILNAPAGFIFNTGSAVTVKVNGSTTSSYNINNLANNATITATVTTTTITITITSRSEEEAPNTLTWQGIQVRPTATSPLASGNITKSGTSSMAGVTNGVTSFGTLTEIASPTVAALTGTASVCAGSTTTLSSTTTGGVWSTSAASKATVSGGVVTGVAAGTATIIYTVTNSSGCVTAVSQEVTVNALPTVADITGTASVCAGSTTTLSSTTEGGVWSTSAASKATVNGSGVVTGVAAGTATITYTVTNSSGCVTAVSQEVTVNALPTVADITGTASVCVGSTTTLSSTTEDGVWSTSAASKATVNSSGVVTGVAAGTATITYTVTNSSGCVTAVSQAVTVNALPTVADITGTASVCVGSTTTLSSTTEDGVWSTSDASKATVNRQWRCNRCSCGYSNDHLHVTNSNGCERTVTQKCNSKCASNSSGYYRNSFSVRRFNNYVKQHNRRRRMEHICCQQSNCERQWCCNRCSCGYSNDHLYGNK
jgi:uncharacterized protein YjdB